MSVKVVSPTDPGQPQLPMSLRPPVTPAAAGTHHGRPRRPRPTPPVSAAELGQPELPMTPPPSEQVAATAAAPAAVESSRSADAPRSAGATADVPVAAAVADAPQPATAADPPVVAAPADVPHPAATIADLPQPAPSADTPRPAATNAGSAEAPPAAVAGLPMPLRPPAANPPATSAARPQAVALSPAAGSDQSQLPMSLRPPAPPAAAALLAQARRGLAEAERETTAAERFIGAYLAALRGAAAVLEARGRPHRGRARPASSWVLLDSVAPELREWSAFFAGNSATRAAAQAGITGKVTGESAAQLVRVAGLFLELVRRLVHGLPISGEAHVA